MSTAARRAPSATGSSIAANTEENVAAIPSGFSSTEVLSACHALHAR